VQVEEIIKGITPINRSIETAAWDKINNKTKPLGSLGQLEKVAVQMSMLKGNLNPALNKRILCVFAGDHGITEEMVSAYPQEVTAQMVFNFLNGGAAINVLCRHYGIDLNIIDMGVNYDFASNTGVIDKKVKRGTNNFLKEASMSREEALTSIQNGIDVFNEIHNKGSMDIIGVGDMGIGNTTSASAIICAITGESPARIAGRGTGINDNTLQKKIETIKRALQIHNINSKDALDVLQKVGGFEIGGITGTILSAAYKKIPIVLDGIITTAGALLAYLFNPFIKDYLFAGHRSVEKGHNIALKFMGLSPILDLHMRLGEGTGAALAMDIIDVSCKIMCEMASFDEAKVDTAL